MEFDIKLLALTNNKSGKKFILVEDDLAGARVRVINPAGNAIVMLRELFAAGKDMIEPEDVVTTFPAEQLAGFERYRDRVREQSERARAAEAASGARRATAVKRTTAAARSGSARTAGLRTPGGSAGASSSRFGGIVDRWSASNAVFYRHKIQPLRANDRFEMTVEGVGSFIMTKDDFERSFNDVVMSHRYQKEGIYSYAEVPERLEVFRKK